MDQTKIRERIAAVFYTLGTKPPGRAAAISRTAAETAELLVNSLDTSGERQALDQVRIAEVWAFAASDYATPKDGE